MESLLICVLQLKAQEGMVLKRLFKSILLLYLFLGNALPVSARYPINEQNKRLILQGIVDFFGKEKLRKMQGRKFSFDIHYGITAKRRWINITSEKRNVEVQLTDNLTSVLKEHLATNVLKHLAMQSSGIMTINPYTNFDQCAANRDPVISLKVVNEQALKDTFNHYVRLYVAKHPDQCEFLKEQIRVVTFFISPFKKAAIERKNCSGCQTATANSFLDYMTDKVSLLYSATTEGCYVDYLDQGRPQLSESESVWCMVNLFGRTHYYMFRLYEPCD